MNMLDIEDNNMSQNDQKTLLHNFGNPRLGFIRKVLGIISFQLLITSAFVYLAQTSWYSFFRAVNGTPNPIASTLFIFSFIGVIVTLLIILCSSTISRTVPINYFLLLAFTVFEAYGVAFTTTLFEPEDVLMAAFSTFSLTIALTIYACVTKNDLTLCGVTLWIASRALMTISLLFAFFGTLHKGKIIISVFAVILYGYYLIFDVQLLVGEGSVRLSLDDYIIGALMIYLDLIILFIRILMILGHRR